MKTIVAFAVFNCLFLISCLQQYGLAAPASQANEDVAAVSSDVKRDAEYRDALFAIYGCRVYKAASAVRAKLQVIFTD